MSKKEKCTRKTKKKNMSKLVKKLKQTKHKKKHKKMVGSGKKKCMCIDYSIDNGKMSIDNNINGHKCKSEALSGQDFCFKHKDCMKFAQRFTSGNEPSYQPEAWNNNTEIKGSHNCYTYFLNSHIKPIKEKCKQFNSLPEKKKGAECLKLKPQPGDFDQLIKYGTLKFKNFDYTCQSMEKKIINDNPSIKKSSYTRKCPKGSYKGAMVTNPYHSYHFYRQNPDGTWSHKPGTLDVTNKDASDQNIYFPHLADRDYKKNKKTVINYNDFCGYYCVPRNSYVNLNAI